MNFPRLRAKSGEASCLSVFLPQHLLDVHRAAVQVLKETADDQLEVLGLPAEAYRKRMERIVRLAAILHDLGKANDHFQGMIYRTPERRDIPQGLRHEWVSVLLIREKLRRWLLPVVGNNEADWAMIEWAIGGHHPAYGRDSPPRCKEPQGEGVRLTVLSQHADFVNCLAAIGSRFDELGSPPRFDAPWVLPLVGPGIVHDRIHQWTLEARQQWEQFSENDKRLVAAVKATLIAADVAGSAIPREVVEVDQRESWIADALANTPLPEELAGIVQKKLDTERAKKNDLTMGLRDFQSAIGQSSNLVTFAKAGCGSGKTLAAYHWAATNHPTKRLWFCYPTTGTATEGFRDYLHNPDAEWNYRLFHGRADVDLALIVEGDDHSAEADALARIESLAAWSTPVVSCTVDSVLGIVQNNRRGVYAWPALAGAAFVFDEIHAYDDKLFGALLRFLQNLPGAPVLLMTASLPNARLFALRDCLKRAKRPPMAEIEGPEELETLPRYHREETTVDIVERVRAECAREGKVLWVSNTVNRAMAAADSIADLTPLIYHSRFRYGDRVKRHQDVVTAFKSQTQGPVVACTTQVCEMSLDLEGVTLLVTELAPVPALIQRLGRLNRKASVGDPTRPFLVIDIGDEHRPYEPTELQSARDWLAELPQRALHQRDLAVVWEKHDASRKPDCVVSAWLDGGPTTTVLELRDASPGISVILEADVASLKAGLKKLAELTLPMPSPPRDWRSWNQLQGVPVAPNHAIEYDPLRGATWRRN